MLCSNNKNRVGGIDMTIDLNTKCPRDGWFEGDRHKYEQCKYCNCCEGFSPDNKQVYCNYSQVPNCEAEFKKGDYAYRVVYISEYYVEKVKVRNAIWVNNHWEYQFGRERHYDRAYKTEEEALKIACKYESEELGERLKRLKNNMEKCGLSFENLTNRLLK